MSQMYEPSADDIRYAQALVRKLYGEFSRACLAANEIESWLLVAKEKGGVSRTLEDVIEIAECMYGGCISQGVQS